MMKPCPLAICDGSGMLDIYFLKTVVRHPNGSCYVKRETISRAVADQLREKLDGKASNQSVETAAKSCECRKQFALT